MADASLAPSWIQVRREVKPARFFPHIKIRTGGFLFSTDFVRMAKLGESSRVSVYTSSDGYRIGFRFHNDETDDSYPLQADGGNGKRPRADARVIQIRPARMSLVLAGLIRSGEHATTRFQPKKDLQGVWYIDLVPSFERTYSGPGDVLDLETGIYRYRLGETTVYVGRGQIKARIADPLRKDWAFDRIEFSMLNNAEVEAKWEGHWLEEHRKRFGILPTYNRIGGLRNGDAND